MELIVISSPDTLENEAQIITQLFEAGVKRFHLRKPNYRINQLIDLLMQIDKQHYPKIAIHQHHEIAGNFGVNRLHYTEKGRANTSLKKLAHKRNNGFILSTSVHDVTLLPSLRSYEYVFFGPVFSSISKPDLKSVIPPNFSLNKKGISSKVIALSGIEESNLNKINEMNFDGAAILGAIWKNPERAVMTFKNMNNAIH